MRRAARCTAPSPCPYAQTAIGPLSIPRTPYCCLCASGVRESASRRACVCMCVYVCLCSAGRVYVYMCVCVWRSAGQARDGRGEPRVYEYRRCRHRGCDPVVPVAVAVVVVAAAAAAAVVVVVVSYHTEPYTQCRAVLRGAALVSLLRARAARRGGVTRGALRVRCSCLAPLSLSYTSPNVCT